jgi:hypothetical protein
VAKRRLMAVDPANRHVAQPLEDDWNDKLEHLQQAKHDYETRCATRRDVLEAPKQAEMRRLATDFPSIWSHPATSHQDKKRRARLLLEDVTLRRDAYSVTLFMRFKAGAILTRMVRLSRSGNKATRIDPTLIAQIDTLTEQHTAGEVATKRNEAGIPPHAATLTPMRSCICSNASSFHRGISGCASEGIGPRKRSPSSVASASKRCQDGAKMVGFMPCTITIKRSICMHPSVRVYRDIPSISSSPQLPVL